MQKEWRSLKLVVLLISFVVGGFCDEQVGRYEKESKSVDFCAPNQYIMQSYFEFSKTLDDSDTWQSILEKLDFGSCESLPDYVSLDEKVSIVERVVIGEGSHRHISTTIRYPAQQETICKIPYSCNLVYIERLPLGVFADPFELQRLQQRGVFTDVRVFGETNLELPSFRSNRSVVEIHVKIGQPAMMENQSDEGKITIKLPLHARYQPLEDSGYSTVMFGKPDLFLCWGIEGEQLQYRCFRLIYDLNEETRSASWEIPAGIRAHKQLVAVITFAVALASSVSLVLASLSSTCVEAAKRLKSM